MESESDTDQTSTSGSEQPAEDQEITLGQRIQQRQLGQMGGGKPFKVLNMGQDTQPSRSKSKAVSVRKTFKRENKNRPTEQTSKKPVPRLRDVIEVHNRRSVDPRFDDLAGRYREETFKKRYSFLYDEQLPEEKAQLKKQMKATKSASRKQELRANLTRVEQQIKTELEHRKKRSAEKAVKAQEKEAVKAGKKPFFLKKSEKKKQELIRKYKELKASGRLEKTLTKRRQKNAAKDHRYVPEAR